MSKKELVEAYLEGDISRRAFLRKLIAVGVSAGAAVVYTNVLTAEKAKAGGGRRRSSSVTAPSGPISPSGPNEEEEKPRDDDKNDERPPRDDKADEKPPRDENKDDNQGNPEPQEPPKQQTITHRHRHGKKKPWHHDSHHRRRRHRHAHTHRVVNGVVEDHR